jgi:uncharacterized membrane protein
MYKAIILIHVLAGSKALISGLFAMFTKKGRGNHNKAGLIYKYAMYVTCLFAVSATLIKFQSFFLAIGLFSFYLVFSGDRAIKLWQLKSTYQVKKVDHLINIFFLLVSVYMVGWPLVKMIMVGKFFVSVLMIFGLIMFFNVLKDFKNYRNSDLFEPKQKYWLLRHIGMMGGSYISAFTAFAVNNIAIEANYLIWLAPTLIGTFFIVKATRNWRNKLGLATVILILLSCFNLKAGNLQKFTGVILSETKSSVAYANIGFVATSVGTVSNASGNFELYLIKENYLGKTLKISHIAFETLEVDFNKNFEFDTIILKSKTQEIQPITISAKALKEKTLGFNKTSTILENNFSISKQPNQNLGAEVAKKFSVGKGYSFLKTFKFYIESNNFDTCLFRLNVYDLKDGNPTKLLNQAPIFVRVENNFTGWYEVDLSKHKIVAQNDIAIGVEWIDKSKKGSLLSLPIMMPFPGLVHYYKYGSQNDWKKYPTMSTAMQLVVLQE